jgi:hypothetical protein
MIITIFIFTHKNIAYYILFQHISGKMSSNVDQIKTIYKISQILGNAFNQVNSLCANFLAEEVIENKSSNQKVVKSQKETKVQPK